MIFLGKFTKFATIKNLLDLAVLCCPAISALFCSIDVVKVSDISFMFLTIAMFLFLQIGVLIYDEISNENKVFVIEKNYGYVMIISAVSLSLLCFCMLFKMKIWALFLLLAPISSFLLNMYSKNIYTNLHITGPLVSFLGSIATMFYIKNIAFVNLLIFAIGFFIWNWARDIVDSLDSDNRSFIKIIDYLGLDIILVLKNMYAVSTAFLLCFGFFNNNDLNLIFFFSIALYGIKMYQDVSHLDLRDAHSLKNHVHFNKQLLLAIIATSMIGRIGRM